MNTQQNYPDNQPDSEGLRLENMQLKKRLEQEVALHKLLYKQWNELNDRVSAQEQQVAQSNPGNSFYKYAFYVILFLLIPAYYFLSHNKKDEKIIPVSQITSSSIPVINPSPITTNDTGQLNNINPKKEDVIQPDIIEPKLLPANKPLIDKTVTSAVTDDDRMSVSVRDSVFSQGWDAYYKGLKNPYQRSSKRFDIWLEGWEAGENGAKKLPGKDSIAH